MILYTTLTFFSLCVVYGLYRLDKARKTVSVLGQAAYLYATTHPEKWQYSFHFGWSCGTFAVNDLGDSTTPRINEVKVKEYEHHRITSFLEKRKKLKKQVREDKKAKELMDFALDEAKKKLEEITNER